MLKLSKSKDVELKGSPNRAFTDKTGMGLYDHRSDADLNATSRCLSNYSKSHSFIASIVYSHVHKKLAKPIRELSERFLSKLNSCIYKDQTNYSVIGALNV